MRALAALVAAVLLGAAAPATVEEVLAIQHPETTDFFAVKTALGAEALRQLQDEMTKGMVRQGAAPGCPDARRSEIYGGVSLAAQSASAEAFAADRTAARKALGDLSSLKRTLWAGGSATDAYNNVTTVLAKAKAATDPRVAELHRRVAEDQFVRNYFMASGADWVKGLSPGARRYLQALVGPELCQVDLVNTAWLKRELATDGWFTISKYGADADSAAWLLVQHADRDRAFQRDVLAMLEKLLPQKETRAANYAYLYDRLASAEKRPQRYGTQGRCTRPGIWEPNDVEDPAKLDERRAVVGLGPEAEYKSQAKQVCP